MTRSYPRPGVFIRPRKNSGRACSLCGRKGAGKQHVQVSWFRGDDEAVACCESCVKAHSREPGFAARLLAALATEPAPDEEGRG